MDSLSGLPEFKSSPRIRSKLIEFGTARIFKESDIILNEDTYIKSHTNCFEWAASE